MPKWLTIPILELLYWSSLHRLFGGEGLGLILQFERVRPRSRTAFQPLRSHEVTADFLDRLLAALRRWDYDIVSIDDVHERLVHPKNNARRFVCLTFEIGYRDFLDYAWPALKRHGAPVTLYLPSSFPDHLGEVWWLALQEVIAGQQRIGFVIDERDYREHCRTRSEKQRLFDFLYAALRAMTPAARSHVIHDLCTRYGVDLRKISSDATFTWDAITGIAADPLLTLASATASYATLASLDRQSVERELKMGRAVLEAVVGRPVPHLAYPFGGEGTFGGRELIAAFENGFRTAVTTVPGTIDARHRDQLLALPRIAWDGRHNLRALRVVLSGLMLKAAARRD